MRPLLLAAALLAVVALAAPQVSAAPPAFGTGRRGFHSVLAYGQRQGTSALDLARNQADGTVSPSVTSQAALYNRVVTSQPAGDLRGFYKDSSFARISGDTMPPIAGATVVRDPVHRVPHIYGETRSAAMYAVGYATAQDRLFLMDVLRRTAEGSTAEILGPSAAPVTAERRFPSDRPALGRSSAVRLDAGSIVPRNAVAESALLQAEARSIPPWAQ